MKSTDRILALRYARAYDALSLEDAEVVHACEALSTAAQTLQQAQAYMQSPAAQLSEKKEFVQKCFGKESRVSQFICTLLQAKRYALLSACVQEVQRLTDVRQGIVRAEVETAYALPAAQQKAVEAALAKLAGQKVCATFAVRPEVLGGFRARFDDKLVDGTLQGQLIKLKQELLK